MRSRGYSLIEAILASFLLVFAFFVVSKLFHTGLQYTSKVDSRLTAVYLAEKRMAEVRLWGKNQTDWTGWPTGNDPEYPAYTIDVRIENRPVFSPCTNLEVANHPAGDRRRLAGAAKMATVEVRWGTSGQYILGAVITENSKNLRPPQRGSGSATTWKKAFEAIDITGVPTDPVRAGEIIPLRARLYAANGDEITDVFFEWNVEPVYDVSDPNAVGNPTMGAISKSRRDGKEANLRNRLKRRDGSIVPSSGEIKVVCHALYNGEIAVGETPVIVLVP